MTSRDEFDQDDALRAALAAADPARSLPAADPAALAVLLRDVTSTDSAAAPRRRTRLTWLVAAAAAVVIAGVGGYAATSSGGDDRAPSAGPAPSSPHPSATTPATTTPTPGGSDLPAPGTTTLSTSAYTGRCAVVTPAFIAAQQQAFSATVTSIDAGTVTMQTTEVYAGDVAQTVQVQAPPADLRALLRSTDFEVGDTYLVAASDGLVAQCGFTGKATGRLRSVYTQAFAR